MEKLQPTKEPTTFKKSYANAVSGLNNVKYKLVFSQFFHILENLGKRKLERKAVA